MLRAEVRNRNEGYSPFLKELFALLYTDMARGCKTSQISHLLDVYGLHGFAVRLSIAY